MSLKNKIVLAGMFILFVLMIMNETQQKRINWYPTYGVKHKIPFGTYIAYNEAKKLFQNDFKNIKHSPYVYLQEHSNATGTYVMYNSSISLGKTNIRKILDWVKKGNNLFISSENIDKGLLDSLHIEQNWYYNRNFNKPLYFKLLQDELNVPDSVFFDKSNKATYFKIPDSVLQQKNIRILGKILSEKNDSLYNFIAYPYHNGTLYLHSLPTSFTNYFILKSKANQTYFEGLLSYFNLKKPVLWDVRIQNGAGAKGIFQYIISNKAFLWAYRLAFIGLFLYILFEGKRKQRPIPVVTPLKNETVQFTKTISDMYLENKEHKQIALIHISHFIDYLRTKLHVDTRKINDKTLNKIAEKSKTDYKTVAQLFTLIKNIERTENVSQKTVLELEKMIQKIKK